MLVYYILFFLLIISYGILPHKNAYSLQQAKNSNHFIFFAAALFIFIMGCRDETVGCDLVNYATRYENSSIGMSISDTTEYGYYLLERLSSSVFHFNFNGFIFLMAFLSSAMLFYVVYRYSKDELVSIFIFVIFLFTMFMSGIRQSLAVSLCAISILFIEKRKLVPYLLIVLSAASIHNSAIIFLPVYFLWNIKLKKSTAVILFIIVLAAFVYGKLLIPVIEYLSPARYDKYELSDGFEINPLVLAVPIIIVGFVLYKLPLCTDEKTGAIVCDNKTSFFYIISCAYLLFMILSLLHNQVGRLAFYFAIGPMVSITLSLTDRNMLSQSSCDLIKVVLCVLCMLYFIISTPGGIFAIDQYKFFWQQ